MGNQDLMYLLDGLTEVNAPVRARKLLRLGTPQEVDDVIIEAADRNQFALVLELLSLVRRDFRYLYETAAWHGNLKCLHAMEDMTKWSNTKFTVNREKALFQAARGGHYAVVEYLLTLIPHLGWARYIRSDYAQLLVLCLHSRHATPKWPGYSAKDRLKHIKITAERIKHELVYDQFLVPMVLQAGYPDVARVLAGFGVSEYAATPGSAEVLQQLGLELQIPLDVKRLCGMTYIKFWNTNEDATAWE